MVRRTACGHVPVRSDSIRQRRHAGGVYRTQTHLYCYGTTTSTWLRYLSLLRTPSESLILITDVARWQSNRDTYLEKILQTACHLLQMAINYAAVGCAGFALHTGVQASWIEPLFLATLQANVTITVKCFGDKVQSSFNSTTGGPESSRIRPSSMDSVMYLRNEHGASNARSNT